MRTAAAVAAMLFLLTPTQGAAQRRDVDRQLREQQNRLDSIRDARGVLEEQLRQLRRSARDINTEIGNLNRQRTSTSRIVNELDRQLSMLTTQLDTMTLELMLVEDALAEKQAILTQRAVAIYRRGSLRTFQVLLAAESFGDLLSRYKYLHIASRQDRRLVDQIATLRNRLATNRRDLVTVQSQVSIQRGERDQELARFATLERQRIRALSQTQRSERQTLAGIDQLEADQRRLNEVIASLVRASRDAAVRVPVATIGPDDLGRLDWPVGGDVIYRFGDQPFRDGTSITRQGIGIRAPEGTTVSAVRAGVVDLAEAQGTFGLLVVLNHGNGYYTLYTYLSRLLVSTGDFIAEGESIGLSGGVNTDEGPHVGFQIRETIPNVDTPVPLDPLNWLRRR